MEFSSDPTVPASIAAVAIVSGKCKHRVKPSGDIPKLAFRRLVQSIVAEINPDLRIQQDATDALQESAEDLVVKCFHRCSKLTELCRMDTLREEHWNFVRDEHKVHTLLG